MAAVVCLCRSQQDYFASLTAAPVILIRHGVSLDFFAPDEKRADEALRLLVVGKWLRDFDTLAASMELIWRANPQAELDCVVPQRQPGTRRPSCGLHRDSRVRWHADISPEQLRDLYRRAALLFMPLIDGTANNGIVEALACGLPIVSSMVGGIVEYVPENCGQLCRAGEPADHAEAVVKWLRNPERLAAARLACRQYAVEELPSGKGRTVCRGPSHPA